MRQLQRRSLKLAEMGQEVPGKAPSPQHRSAGRSGRPAGRPSGQNECRGPHDTQPFGGDTTAFSRKTPAGPPERSPCPGLTPSSGADAAVTWTGSRGSVTVPKTRGPPRTVGGLLCLRSVNVRRSPSVSSTVTEQGMLAAEFCSARDPFQYGAAPWWCTRSHPRALTETDGMRVVLVPAATPAILCLRRPPRPSSLVFKKHGSQGDSCHAWNSSDASAGD